MILQAFDNANLSFINSVRKGIWGEFLSLSLSLVSQLFICNTFFQSFKSFYSFFFVCKAKIYKFYSFLWILLRATHSQHIFCYAKNRYACAATKSQATSRNDEVAKIHKIHAKFKQIYKFFSNFYSTRFQNFEKFNTKESK